MIIYLSVFVFVIGALFYLLSKDPKRAELGKLAFAVGLLAFLLHGEELVTLFKSVPVR